MQGGGGGADRALGSCWQGGAAAGSSHHGREQAWLEAGETPMPEAPTRPNHELWDRAHRPPVLPRPPVRWRVGTDLRRTSRGNSGGRRSRSRACVQLVRPRLVRGASQPHLQRGPRSGLVHNQRKQLPSMHRRQTEHTCERTWAGRAYLRGHGERTGRRVRCFSTHAPLGQP